MRFEKPQSLACLVGFLQPFKRLILRALDDSRGAVSGGIVTVNRCLPGQTSLLIAHFARFWRLGFGDVLL